MRENLIFLFWILFSTFVSNFFVFFSQKKYNRYLAILLILYSFVKDQNLNMVL